MSVKVACAPDRSDFTGGETSGDRWFLKSFSNDRKIMPAVAEQLLPAAIATHQKYCKRVGMQLLRVQQEMQILVGRLGIADVELNSLSAAWKLADDDAVSILIHPEDASNQKISTSESRLLLIKHRPKEKPALQQVPLILGQ